MLTSWFKFQLDSSSGVGCSERTYTNTYIYSHSINTEGPLFYYFMFICASFGSKISGFQETFDQKYVGIDTNIVHFC